MDGSHVTKDKLYFGLIHCMIIGTLDLSIVLRNLSFVRKATEEDAFSAGWSYQDGKVKISSNFGFLKTHDSFV